MNWIKLIVDLVQRMEWVSMSEAEKVDNRKRGVRTAKRILVAVVLFAVALNLYAFLTS